MPKNLRMRLLLGAAAILVAGLGIGWLRAGDMPDATKVVAPAETWREPALAHVDTVKALASLATHSLWGEPGPATTAAPAEAAKPAAPSWRLSGIFDQNGPLVAVILVTDDGKPAHAQIKKRGDDLPDGSHIVDINKTAITVAGATGQRQVKLFYPN